MKDLAPSNAGKFVDPHLTAKGETRATVPLSNPQTLWFNTGTLCNIECVNCYIASSPTNDALVYITEAEVADYLGQLTERKWPVTEIAFTGGEPFMNPEIIGILRASLAAGYEVLVLTNAMLPMMRKRIQAGLTELNAAYPGKLTLRVSLDHHQRAEHDQMRGTGAFDKTLCGMDWLRDQGIAMAVAGRTIWGESDAEGRAGFAALFAERGYDIEAADPVQTVLFPEMDESVEVPEITTACWDILSKRPEDVMCASSRMVVKHKGKGHPSVAACTLLPYAEGFDLGRTLEEAERDVALNHPHCAKFCVLGGASCSA
ncbi:MAG: radical SAM protein [Shimia sp.]